MARVPEWESWETRLRQIRGPDVSDDDWQRFGRNNNGPNFSFHGDMSAPDGWIPTRTDFDPVIDGMPTAIAIDAEDIAVGFTHERSGNFEPPTYRVLAPRYRFSPLGQLALEHGYVVSQGRINEGKAEKALTDEIEDLQKDLECIGCSQPPDEPWDNPWICLDCDAAWRAIGSPIGDKCQMFLDHSRLNLRNKKPIFTDSYNEDDGVSATIPDAVKNATADWPFDARVDLFRSYFRRGITMTSCTDSITAVTGSPDAVATYMRKMHAASVAAEVDSELSTISERHGVEIPEGLATIIRLKRAQ